MARTLCLAEDFEQALRVRIVGPVIVGECQLLRPAAQPGEGAAEPLPGRRHGLVAHGRSCGDGRADHVAEHDVAIVNVCSEFEISIEDFESDPAGLKSSF